MIEKKKSLLIAFAGLVNVADAYTQNVQPYTSVRVESSSLYQQGNVYQKDFLLCMDMLEQTHPAFAAGQNAPFSVDDQIEAGYEALAECQSKEALERCVQRVFSNLSDAHTTVSVGLDRNLIYPLNVFVDSGKPYIRAVDKVHAAALGKEIIRMNGRSMNRIWEEFGRVMSCDNENYFWEKVPNLMQFYSSWVQTSCSAPDSLLRLSLADGTEIALKPMKQSELQVQWLNVAPSGHWIRGNRRQPFLYKILPDRPVCYLQFNACTDRGSLYAQYAQTKGEVPDEVKKQLEQVPRFDEFLRQMFRDMATHQVKTLVIDVRDNGGGDSRLCQLLLSWLKPEAERKQGTVWMRCSELFKRQYPALSESFARYFAEHRQVYSSDTLYNAADITLPETGSESSPIVAALDTFFASPSPAVANFDGEVIFIQNRGTYSSAGLLVVEAVDSHIGKVIGDCSAYNPSSYGDILFWRLPHTGVQGTVSHKLFLRPDRSQGTPASLCPDVLIPTRWEDVSAGRDACWEWVLQHVK